MTPEVSLVIGGIPVAGAVFAIIQVLKWGQFLRSERETRLAVICSALIFGAAWAAVQFKPEIGPAITTVVTALVGVAISVSAYQALIGKKG